MGIQLKTMKKQRIVGARRVGLISIYVHHPPDEVRTISILQNARLAPNEKTMKNRQTEKACLAACPHPQPLPPTVWKGSPFLPPHPNVSDQRLVLTLVRIRVIFRIRSQSLLPRDSGFMSSFVFVAKVFSRGTPDSCNLSYS